MIVTLTQREIEQAVRAFIANKLPGSPTNFPIEFINSRAPNGLSATVDLDATEAAPQQQVPASKPVVQPAVATNSSPLAAAFQASQVSAAAHTPVAAAEPEALVEQSVEEQPAEEQPVQAAAPAPNKLFG